MEHLARIPKNRIAVLIGKRGSTRKMIEKACKASLHIESNSGDVSVVWPDEGSDPVIKMKLPDVIFAIGRGLAPKRAIQLLEDDVFLRMYDIREWVGRQPNQTRRMRSRLIGTNGMAIYGSTVLVIGDQESLALATPAIEGILQGSEHGTVLFGLEQDRKRQRIRSYSLETYEEKVVEDTSTFEALVPSLADARRRRERKFTNSQVDPLDQDAITEMMKLADDEKIVFEEE
uniref:Ribosomal RNA assembly protein (KRR1) n=2 Tax=uncultured Poseidoniia archaeon TaxID=1697135 RepID=A0A1B1TFK2_9ARCH|nr:ribosomal RNA assembly protein (KRR1) [uncultured Candidatus Thalassoarchaea sp.]